MPRKALKIAPLKIPAERKMTLDQRVETINKALDALESEDFRSAIDFDYGITKNRVARYDFNEDYNFEIHVRVSDVGQTVDGGATFKVQDVIVELEVSDINTHDLDKLQSYAQLMLKAVEMVRALEAYNGLTYDCIKTLSQLEREAAQVRLAEFLHANAREIEVDGSLEFDAPQLGMSNGVHKERVGRKQFEVTVSVGKFTVRRTA